MDYKYIEQLLERYFAAETTLEEEDILRAFFSQKDIPAGMEKYRDLFTFQLTERNEGMLGDDFDARMLDLIKETAHDGKQAPTVVKARVITLNQRLMPLFKSAAVIAIFLTLGNAAQKPWDASWNDSPAGYAERFKQQVDSLTVTPIQAENISDMPVDSTKANEVIPKD